MVTNIPYDTQQRMTGWGKEGILLFVELKSSRFYYIKVQSEFQSTLLP